MESKCNAIEYVIVKDENQNRFNKIKIYEFNIIKGEAHDIKEPRLISREELIDKIRNKETFSYAVRKAQKSFQAVGCLNLSINNKGYVNDKNDVMKDKINKVDIYIS